MREIEKGEKERERERERQRERDRDRDRQTDRQTDRQAGISKLKNTDNGRDNWHGARETDEQTGV